MQIVIDIEDNTYEAIEHEYCILPPQKGLLKVLWDAIHNGTPLPKGHGRLIDADRIVRTAEIGGFGNNRDIDFVLSYIPKCKTIIEADGKEQE